MDRRKTNLPFWAFTLLFALRLEAQQPDLDAVFRATKDGFAKLSGLDVHYTSSLSYPMPNGIKEHDVRKSELKVSGTSFWYKEEIVSGLDAKDTLLFIIAYDGKRFAALDNHGDLQLSNSPKAILPGRLATTPLIKPYLYMLSGDHDTYNVFERLRGDDVWKTVLKTSSLGPSEKGTENLTVHNDDREEYHVKIALAKNGFPIFWNKMNAAGYPVTFQCSDFRTYRVNGSTLQLPTRYSETLTVKGNVVMQFLSDITAVSALPANPDAATFEIPFSAAQRIYDCDIGAFVK